MPRHALSAEVRLSTFPYMVAPVADWYLPVSSSNVSVANSHLSFVSRVPVTGVLHDVAIYVQTSSGNVSATVWDVGAAGATRNRLWSSGSVACGAQGWQVVGDPSLSVTAGQLVALGIGCDNITATFGTIASLRSGPAANIPAAFASEGSLRIASFNSGFPDPGTTLVPSATTLALMVVARVTPS